MSHSVSPHTSEKAMDIVNNVKASSHRIRNSIATIFGLVALTGCATNAPQDTWQPRGENAQIINNLQWIVFPMAGVVGVLATRRCFETTTVN